MPVTVSIIKWSIWASIQFMWAIGRCLDHCTNLLSMEFSHFLYPPWHSGKWQRFNRNFRQISGIKASFRVANVLLEEGSCFWVAFNCVRLIPTMTCTSDQLLSGPLFPWKSVTCNLYIHIYCHIFEWCDGLIIVSWLHTVFSSLFWREREVW